VRCVVSPLHLDMIPVRPGDFQRLKNAWPTERGESHRLWTAKPTLDYTAPSLGQSWSVSGRGGGGESEDTDQP